MATILFLSANPKGTSRLRLDQELRDIDEGLRRSRHRDSFQLEQRMAARPRDIQRAMLDVSPQIVHFSGHGTGANGLVFENESGRPQHVDGLALANLFALFADQVRCVVLNGCYSEVQAKAITAHVDYVIGMSEAIGDRAALEFAVGFYDALGAGRTVEFAHQLGCSAIQLSGVAEHLTPVLIKNELSDAASASLEGTDFEDLNRQGSLSRLNALRKPVFTTVGIVVAILGVRLLGFLEPLELDIYDHLLRLRSPEVALNESRIAVIEATAEDHQIKREKNESGPGALSNEALSEVLQQLAKPEYKPAVIALDIYRDDPADPLVEQFSQTPNLFAVCESPYEGNETGTQAPITTGIPPAHVGFSNLIPDMDAVLRRQLVELPPSPGHPCQAKESLALLAALRYIDQQSDGQQGERSLSAEEIWTPEGDLQLNGRLIRRIKQYSFGGYQYLDSGGVQFLLNYRTPRTDLREIAPHFSIEAVRKGEVPGEYLKDKIVLIGITDRTEAVDYFQTPYGETAGVTIHAHQISQLVSAALDGRSQIWAWPQGVEFLWLSGWTIIGTLLGIYLKSRRLLIVSIATGVLTIYGVCVLTMNVKNGWLPMLPPMIGIVLSGAVVHHQYPRETSIEKPPRDKNYVYR